MITNNVMLGIVGAWTVAFESVMFAQCTSPRVFWTKFESDYVSYCINFLMMFRVLAFSDLILDALVLASPIPLVVLLHLPWRKKIAVLDVLLLGAMYVKPTNQPNGKSVIKLTMLHGQRPRLRRNTHCFVSASDQLHREAS